MAFFPLRALLPILLAAGAAGQAMEVQSGAAGTPERFAPHPYKSALGAVANYRSCGVRARAGPAAALDAALRAGEAAARAKGLGPMLERLRQDYHALLAVSTMMACARGPAAALAGARRAVADFQRWVAAQPAG
jgi:hypothetical protein